MEEAYFFETRSYSLEPNLLHDEKFPFDDIKERSARKNKTQTDKINALREILEQQCIDKFQDQEESLLYMRSFDTIYENSGDDSTSESGKTSPSTCFEIPYTYNTIIWVKNKSSLKKTNIKPLETHQIVTDDGPVELRFNIFPVSSEKQRSKPWVVDSMICIIEDLNDVQEINRLKSECNYAWSKIALIPNPELYSIIQSGAYIIEIPIFKSLGECLEQVHKDDIALQEDLQNWFYHSDQEKILSLFQENLKSGSDGLNNFLKRIKEGNASLREFNYWWKKGKQGGLSIQKSLLSFLAKIAVNFSNSLDSLELLGNGLFSIDKTTLTKELSIKIGPEFQNPKSKLSLVLGKSAKREQILNEVNKALSFNMRETWFSITLSAKNGTRFINLISDTFKAILNSWLASSYDGGFIKDCIGIEVKKIADKIFIGLWADFTHYQLEKVMKVIDFLEDHFRSPIDDFLDLSLTFRNGIKELLRNKDTSSLFDALNLTLTFVHWKQFADTIASIMDMNSLYKFFPVLALLTSGKIDIRLKSLMQFRNISPFSLIPTNRKIIDHLKDFISVYINEDLLLSNLLNNIIGELSNKIEIFTRFNNFGAKLTIEVEDLFEFFQECI
ncbi:unnamed protein product [Blepharisma stoltei]|uniref:Uncharacterized protein n=1 Tax=Blepharisma stoltei TaxID=1481888 RepID=A0AAU9J365_9CILI|nr:unnamed protein product [Blepharisma stoltei]